MLHMVMVRERCGRHHLLAQAESSFLGNMPNLETSETIETPTVKASNQGIGDDIVS